MLKYDAGGVMAMKNFGFAGALPFDETTAQLAPSGSSWHDPKLPPQFETKSGARGFRRWGVN